jgi:V8-like Glu-specific endopeptidase
VFDDSVFALIPGARLKEEGGGRIAVRSMTLREKYSVCDDEPFAGQVTAAWCGGVLIGSDLVLTAGHCFDVEARCDRFSYVMGYAGDRPVLEAERVYGCRDVVASRYDVAEGRHVDFAIVKLDRPARGVPASIVQDPPRVGQAVAMLGFPNGLPGKVDTGGTATHASSDHFQATLDAFAGNSGSPVFDDAGALRGILVAGAPYDYVAADGCWRARRVLDDEIASHGAERIALPGAAVEALSRIGDGLVRSVRCSGLDCTADDPGDLQMLPPPGKNSPDLLGLEKTAPGARGCCTAPPVRPSGFGTLAALFACVAWRRRTSKTQAESRPT